MRRAMQTVGWGLYLASSWTWCIGMFLPILLLRWWGWPGFLAFAVPNVLGCALFGYVLTPASSRALVARFPTWIALFGAATIAYQVGFLLAAGPWAAILAAAPPSLVLLLSTRRPTSRSDRTLMVAGVVAWIVSALLFLRLGSGAIANLPQRGTLPPTSLVWAAPFMAFGFLLCPYLDPTFHLALQRAPSRHAFGVFGVAFAAMLLLTAALYDTASGRAAEHGPIVAGQPLLHWQWGVQAAFTIVAVAGAMRSLEPVASLGGSRRAVLPAMVITACLALGWEYWAEPMLPTMAATLLPAEGVVLGEATYLRWLGLYGVLFPAMLLLGLRRVPVGVTVVAIVGAGWLAEIGMIGARMPLLTAAVALLMLASLWTSGKTSATSEIAPADSR